MAKKPEETNTVKVKAAVINPKRYTPGETINHYGHTCVVDPDGYLVCDMDAEMAEIEIKHGRFIAVAVAETKPAPKPNEP